MADYNKIGLLVLRGDRVLLCRKRRGTSLLILPGGCLEEGESAAECLTREIREELGEAVTAHSTRYLGHYEDRAAGDGPPKTVSIELYAGELDGEPVASSEIAALIWYGPEDDRGQVSPILANHILPDLIARGVLTWPRG